MIDVNLIRKNPEQVERGIAAKNADSALVGKFLDLDEKWRKLNKEFDDSRAKQKSFGKDDRERAGELKERLKKIGTDLSDLDKMRQEVLHQMPNLPLSSVPAGKSEKENKVIREWGGKSALSNPKDYLALAQSLDIIDVERASKVSGSRFGYLKGAAAMLEFALIDLAMKTLTKEGFVPIIPPVLIKPEMMAGMGKVKFIEAGDAFYIPSDDLYLVGSSEHSIGPMHKDEIFSAEALPKRYAGFSTCFRREAGSYGKDTKGILRVHQFDKVEMFSYCEPDKSEKEHEFLLSLQEKLMQSLKLPYRVMEICAGDMGWTDARQFDIEAWLPGQNSGKGEYRETNSTSNTTDYQARRLNIKYKSNVIGQKSNVNYVHMLNGTAFAIGRMIIAILENYQTEKGTIKVPAVLQPYMQITEIN